MSVTYTKPTAEFARKVSNAMGVIPASKMMKIRERATKMVFLDHASYLINEKKLSYGDVLTRMEKLINTGIEEGLCSQTMLTTIAKFVESKFKTIDPVLKLHCAITMETIDELGGNTADGVDASVLPEEVQSAAECGADCFGGGKPSLEHLTMNVSDCQQKLYQAIGGSMCTQVLQKLQGALDSDYTKSR